VGTQPRPAAGAAATPAADTGRCTSSGAPVALGQVGTFSGLAGPIAGDGLAAMAVWAKDVNARGGLACHPVTIYVRDDGGDPARVAAAVKELLGRGVVAFIGNITALSQQGFKPEIDRNCTPAIGIDFGIDWSTDPCLFPQGGGWNESIAGLVEQAVERHHTKLGLLYCVEINTCSSIGKGIKAAADRVGIELVYSSAISLTQTDYTAQCQNAKNAGVEELIVAMEGSAMARLARSCLALNYRPLLVGAAFAVNPKQADDPKLRELGLAAVNANAPWFATDQPGLRAYQAALHTYAPQVATSGITLQMYAAGKVLEAGVANLGPAARTGPLTSAQILAGLNKIKHETLGGLTAPLDFTVKGKPRSSGCVYLTLLGASGWTTPDGTKPLCPKGAA
jgi:branched-chain amino acid transport system substrate-binding protein